jgi:hypothetical protein
LKHSTIAKLILVSIYVTGQLVSGTQCLAYTALYINNESITRSPNDVNYLKYSIIPKKCNRMWAEALVLSKELSAIQHSSLHKQYVLQSSREKIDNQLKLAYLNIINNNRYSDWDNRETMSKNVYAITPLTEVESYYRSGGFKCTCQKYMDEYDCKHALAISIVKHKLKGYLVEDIKLGPKKRPGRPRKAVEGALNHQCEENKKRKGTQKKDLKQLLLMEVHQEDSLFEGNLKLIQFIFREYFCH